MKAQVLSLDGMKEKEIELPKCFEEEVRKDIIKKAFESEISTLRTPYGSFEFAGKLVSASGKIKHRRRKWKTAYGKGISRVSRKIKSKERLIEVPYSAVTAVSDVFIVDERALDMT